MSALIKMAKDAVNDDKPMRALALAMITIAEEITTLRVNSEKRITVMDAVEVATVAGAKVTIDFPPVKTAAMPETASAESEVDDSDRQ